MQKRHLTLAVVAALTAPAAAFAQTSNVEIYGRASLGLDNYSATGSTAGASADYKAATASSTPLRASAFAAPRISVAA